MCATIVSELSHSSDMSQFLFSIIFFSCGHLLCPSILGNIHNAFALRNNSENTVTEPWEGVTAALLLEDLASVCHSLVTGNKSNFPVTV